MLAGDGGDDAGQQRVDLVDRPPRDDGQRAVQLVHAAGPASPGRAGGTTTCSGVGREVEQRAVQVQQQGRARERRQPVAGGSVAGDEAHVVDGMFEHVQPRLVGARSSHGSRGARRGCP